MKRLSLIFVGVFCMAYAQSAFAAESGAVDFRGYLGLGAGIAIGLAAAGGAIGQGWAAATALQGIARNPSASDKIQTPMILGLALIESLVIYALVVGILLYTKIEI